jgi:hypothetical protein
MQLRLLPPDNRAMGTAVAASGDDRIGRCWSEERGEITALSSLPVEPVAADTGTTAAPDLLPQSTDDVVSGVRAAPQATGRVALGCKLHPAVEVAQQATASPSLPGGCPSRQMR